jgi:hypothetical protein
MLYCKKLSIFGGIIMEFFKKIWKSVKQFFSPLVDKIKEINNKLDQRTKNYIGLGILVVVLAIGLVMCHANEKEPIFSFLGRDQFDKDDDDDKNNQDDDDENNTEIPDDTTNNNSDIQFEQPSGSQENNDDNKLHVGGESVSDDDDDTDWSIPF